MLLPILTALLGTLTTLPTDSMLERAEWLYLNRHLETGYIDSALTLTARIYGQEPGNEPALALRARIYLQFGEDATNRETRRHFFDSSRATADTLRRLNAHNPAGHLWWASAHGRLVKMQGSLRAMTAVPTLRRAFERATALGPGDPLARYAYGRLLMELPGPLGGSTDRAAQEFRAACNLDRGYTAPRRELARLLYRSGRRAEAIAQLDTILATVDPSHPAEHLLRDRPQTRELLKQWRGRPGTSD